jgi:type IV pilus assembly protein PilE
MMHGGKRLQVQRGFTLIEIMIVVVIVSILMAIALPAFRNQIIRGHRAAAQSQMMDLANREQQFLLANRAYADKTTIETNGYGLPTDVADKYGYTITVTATPVPTFLITFIPSGVQARDGSLTLNYLGVKLPTDKW